MAAIGQRYYSPNQFEIDVQGVPLASGQLFFYLTGTSTPLDTYQDVNLTVPNPNPIIADANGRFGSIWLSASQAYKVQLWTAATVTNPTGSQIWSEDPVGSASGGVPTSSAGIIGEIRDFAGLAVSVPALWYLCYGQAVSRTTFASLFAVIGTLWGAGDASTTFNLPDLRGRGTFGRDDMGGSAANRLTSGVSGVAGATVGAVGGNQATQVHTHSVSDPTHNHSLTDPGHIHTFTGGAPVVYINSAGNLDAATGTKEIGRDMNSQVTGITLAAAATGITLGNFGAGSSQNVPPAAVVNRIIYAGV